MASSKDTRIFLLDILEPATCSTLKGALAKYANYMAVSSSTAAASCKTGVFLIARSEKSEVQLKVRL